MHSPIISSKVRNVFIDMEGVLVDVSKMIEITGHTIKEIKETPGMYLKIQPVHNSIASVEELLLLGFNVWIAIKPPRAGSTPFLEKKSWVSQYLPRLEGRIICTPHKGLLGGVDDVLIDDRPESLGSGEFKGTFIHFNNGLQWDGVLEQMKALSSDPRRKKLKHPPAIVTKSGKPFDFVDIDVKNVDIEEIAHALSNICRFTGHTKQFYSVAQHSVLVSENVPKEDALAGLLHDASEAYLGDMASPLKQLIPEYLRFEKEVQEILLEKFCLHTVLPASVKEADMRALMTEQRDLFDPEGQIHHMFSYIRAKPFSKLVIPMSPTDAKKAFMRRYENIITEISKESTSWFMAPAHFKRLRFMLGMSGSSSSTEWGSKNSFLAVNGTKEYADFVEMRGLGLVVEGKKDTNHTYFHATESACSMLNLNPTQIDNAMRNIVKI